MTLAGFDRGDVTLANWRAAPFSAYAFEHVSEFVPVARIQETASPEAPDPGSGALARIELLDADGTRITAREHFRRSFTDHFVAMRDWEVIGEWHAPGRRAAAPHIVFSISKSVTGLVAGIAAAEGFIDPEDPVTRHVPSVEGSAYGTARLRDLLDMSVDLDFDEDYPDADGAFDRYRRAMLWNPEREDTRPETLEAFLGALGARGTGHGRRFFYASPNTDLLGLAVERASGTRFHEFLREKLWRPMGARGAADVTLDRVGTARAAGGICMTTRDLARMGQLVMAGGQNAKGRQVVSPGWIGDLRFNGDRRAWAEGNFSDMFDNGRYRSCWYDVGDGRGSFAAVGIHGQWLWCDPQSDIVLAKTSCRPEASNDAETALEISMLAQIALQLES